MLTRKIILDALRQGEALGRHDANETAMFLRELEHIYAKVNEQVYPEYKARQLMRINSEPSNADENHTFRTFDRVGEAKIVSTYTPNDFPNVEVTGAEFTSRIVSLGNSFGYTIQEMRASSATGRSLPQMRGSAARASMESKLDRLACVGDSATGLVGLANVAGTNNLDSYATHDWTNAGTTVAQMVADLNAASNALFTASKGVTQADTLLLPTAAYSSIINTPVSLTYGAPVSVAQYLLAQNKWLKKIDFWSQLDTADGVGGPRALLYQDMPETAELVIPQDFEQFAPQLVGLRYDINCHMRWGGVKSVQPFRIGKMDVIGG